MMRYEPNTKRLFDLLVLLLALPVLLPIMLAVFVLVRLRLGSPVFFSQPRPGKNGQIFNALKFRTMLDSNDVDGNPLPDAERMTSFGSALRSSSLDELPALWNVFVGNMSLVGPRPLLPEYLPLYNPEQARRHEMRPGLTGWAQVNGRNSISWEERFSLDVWYVNNCSLMLDIRIMALTMLKVARRDGISAEGEATMSRFTGSSTNSR